MEALNPTLSASSHQHSRADNVCFQENRRVFYAAANMAFCCEIYNDVRLVSESCAVGRNTERLASRIAWPEAKTWLTTPTLTQCSVCQRHFVSTSIMSGFLLKKHYVLSLRKRNSLRTQARHDIISIFKRYLDIYELSSKHYILFFFQNSIPILACNSLS